MKILPVGSELFYAGQMGRHEEANSHYIHSHEDLKSHNNINNFKN